MSYNKYYSEDEPEFFCPVCRKAVDATQKVITCTNCFPPDREPIRHKKAHISPADLSKLGAKKLETGISRLIGRRLTKQELVEVMDLISYYLREE